MNYITSLRAENVAQAGRIAAMQSEVTALMAYLTSDKFAVDNTVQCRDVLARLTEIRSAGL